MAVQTTYTETMPGRFKGAIRNTEPNVLISRTVETAAVSFGGTVVQSATIDKAVHPVTTGDTVLLGIAVWDRGVDPATPDSYPVGSTARIMRQGVVTVTAGATVAAGDPVHVVVATGVYTNTGAVTFLQGGRYETSGDSGDLVDVRLG